MKIYGVKPLGLVSFEAWNGPSPLFGKANFPPMRWLNTA
jgi:hypothetical protein